MSILKNNLPNDLKAYILNEEVEKPLARRSNFYVYYEGQLFLYPDDLHLLATSVAFS